MTGQVIGQVMTNGYAGSYSRQPDMVVDTAPAEGVIAFGQGVVYGEGAGVVLPSDSSTAAEFVGIALREVKSATECGPVQRRRRSAGNQARMRQCAVPERLPGQRWRGISARETQFRILSQCCSGRI